MKTYLIWKVWGVLRALTKKIYPMLFSVNFPALPWWQLSIIGVYVIVGVVSPLSLASLLLVTETVFHQLHFS